jgi:hypothetical protein
LFFGGWLASRLFEEYNPNQNRAELWPIFDQVKMRQPIGRTDSILTGKKQEVGGIFV